MYLIQSPSRYIDLQGETSSFVKHSYFVSCPQLSITKTRVAIPNRTYASPKTNVNPRIVRPHRIAGAAF